MPQSIKPDVNCDIWADVDFGHGPVEIRCTRTGDHETHSCYVMIKSELAPVEDSPVLHGDSLPIHNVFEGDTNER